MGRTLRLTARGRVMLGFAVGFGAAGRVLALQELSMVGAALLVVLAVGAATVWMRRGTIAVSRSVHPTRTTAGNPVRVEVEARASGRVGGGPVLLQESVPDVLGDPIPLTIDRFRDGRSTSSVAYVLRPPVRGHYTVGPLEVVHTDPFGAIERTEGVPGHTSFVVYPSYEAVRTIPAGLQRLGVVRHSPLLGQGDEFYALREYTEGDDLRKVHWPSSARLGRLHIRQEELLGEPRAIVVLDTCAGKHRGSGADASLEAAISACASVAALALNRRMRLEVFTSDGPLGTGRRPSETELLERLAVLQPSGRDDLSAGLSSVDPRRTGGSVVLVVITPGLGRAEAGALAALAGRAASGALVRVAAETWSRGARPTVPDDLVGRVGLPVVELRRGRSFRAAWEAGVRDVALAR